MCGIAGIFDLELSNAERQKRLDMMLDAIKHRGPDDSGAFIKPMIALGHRRLAIVDLSPTGHQPMHSASGRYVIAFNGEIYNHVTLRSDLHKQGTHFRGHSDTETLLALIERHGLQKTLELCVGMFAIALWDVQEQTLSLARDRFGEKPLYLAVSSTSLHFASELKALRSLPDTATTINPQAVYDLISYGYIRKPHSIWLEVQQVEPGHIYEFSASQNQLVKKQYSYWSAESILINAQRTNFEGSFEEAVDEAIQHISSAVKLQMQADVPLGAFLSGGIDSSLITALMTQQAACHQVKTYSIGFHDAQLNEASYAKAVATHLGTQHTEWYVGESEVMDLITHLHQYYDEPLADPSQLPTIILAKLTRKDVTVALSGDGADELFGGYPKYWLGHRTMQRPFRTMAGRAAGLINRLIFSGMTGAAPSLIEKHLPIHSIQAFSALYGSESSSGFIDSMNRVNRNAAAYLPDDFRSHLQDARTTMDTQLSFQRQAMLTDVLSYLPYDILVKVDRATMAASLESRAPFLDHRVFEFAAGLPDDFLFTSNGGKHILRESLKRFLPKDLIDRPKSGFSPPIGKWLRGSLRGWALEVLNDPRVADVLDLTSSRRLLALHCDSQFDLSARLWPILSLAHWYKKVRLG